MARKKYRKKSHSRGNSEGNLIEGIVSLSILLAIMLYWMQLRVLPTITAYINNNLFTIIWVSFFIAFLLSIYLFRNLIFKRNPKVDIDSLSEDKIFRDLVGEIKEFAPLKRYSTELPYQTELAGYLKRNFKGLVIEETRSDTRPDIVVENIAIEIKGPTTSKDLHTIADKIIRYLKHYDKLIVVLFSLELEEKEYNEWKKNVLEAFSHNSERLSIIEL